MSWLFSQALAEEYSAGTCSDGEPSVPSNSTPTPQAYCSPDKMTAFSRLSRFGMTYAPLTADRGEALLTSFLAAFPARTSVQQGGAPALMANDLASGEKWRESSVRYCPDSSSWRTHRCLWDEALPWSSVTLPRWGMTVNGVVYRHPTLERPISATASGLWQTPVADDAIECKAGKWNSRGEPKLSAEVKLWPTPKANDAEKRGNFDTTNPRNGLPAAVKAWPTPTSSLGTKGGLITPRKSREGGTLIEAVSARTWPTPTASASKGSSPAALTRKDGQDRSNDRLDHAVMASEGGQLNPTWVEWLMGWPLGWTDLKPLEMDKFREWLQQHSMCSENALEATEAAA